MSNDPEHLNDPQYLSEQYRDASNLNARISLHQRFSANKYGWHPWVFDQLDLPPQCRLLGLGSGPGDLWLENLERIPPGWQITLSDHSEGMVEQARCNLSGKRPFQFEIIDAQVAPFPFESGYFDAVIANHMLYHLADRPTAFSEIRRVLKPGGRFYATTAGEGHLKEINELMARFDPKFDSWGAVTSEFTLENGAAQLAAWFADIETRRYEDSFIITDLPPLIDYILSGWAHMEGERRTQFEAFMQAEMARCGGVFHITKDSGIFASKNP